MVYLLKILFDNRQFCAKCAIHKAGEKCVEARLQRFGRAKLKAAAIAAQCAQDLAGNQLRGICLCAKFHVQGGHPAVVHGRLRRSGGQVVHRERRVRIFTAQRFGKSAQRKLARTIGSVAGEADGTKGGSNDDDSGASPIEQQRQQGLREKQCCRYIGVNNGAHVAVGKRAELVDARVSAQGVDRKCACALAQSLAISGVSEIGNDRFAISIISKAAFEFSKARFATPLQQYRVSLAGKSLRQGSTYTAAGAGQQNAHQAAFARWLASLGIAR